MTELMIKNTAEIKPFIIGTLGSFFGNGDYPYKLEGNHLRFNFNRAPIDLAVLDPKEFKKVHLEKFGNDKEDCSAFCFDNTGFPGGNAYILQGDLSRVYRGAVHETCHLITPRLKLLVNEEAKAYAGHFALYDAAKKVGGLDKKILTLREPAGGDSDHLRAYQFVLKQISSGADPWKLFVDISHGRVHVD